MRISTATRNQSVSQPRIPVSQINAAHTTGHGSTEAIVDEIARRKMVTPFLLFVVSHKPLAFLAGQMLYLIEPLADILDIEACAELAALLSEPEAVRQALETFVEMD